MNGNFNRTWIAYAMLTVLVAAVIVSALIIVPQKNWDARFFLSTGALVFSAIQLFAVPLVYGARSTPGSAPWHAAQSTVSVGYLFAAVVLALYGLGDVSLQTLIVLHIVAFVALVFGLGFTTMASGHSNTARAELVSRKQWFVPWRARFEKTCDQIALLTAAELSALKAELAKLRDDLAYADRESLPGSEAIELELNGALDEIVRQGGILEAEVRSGDAARIAAAAAELSLRLDQLRSALRRRDETLRALR